MSTPGDGRGREEFSMAQTVNVAPRARPPVQVGWKIAVIAWVVLYAVPPSPLAPFFGWLIAAALGPPYLMGYNEHGWPVVGPVTPQLVMVTVILPWIVTSACLVLLAHVFGREPRSRPGCSLPEHD